MIIQTEYDYLSTPQRVHAYHSRLLRTRECDAELFHLRARAGRALQHCLSRGGTPSAATGRSAGWPPPSGAAPISPQHSKATP